MASLVERLQGEALDRSVRVEDLLRKAKVVAFKLGLTDFEAWVDRELNGYVADDEVPRYRQIKGELYGFSRFRGWEPVIWGEDSGAMRKQICHRPFGQPIGLVADLSHRESDDELAMDLGSLSLRNSLGEREPTNVQLHIDRSQLAGILDAVRNTILKWSLELERDGIVGEGMSFSETEKEKARRAGATYQIGSIENFSGVMGAVSDRVSVRSRETNISVKLDVKTARELVDQIKVHLPLSRLPDDQKQSVGDEVQAIEAELSKQSPDHSKVRAVFRSIRRILESAATGAATDIITAGLLSAIRAIA